MVSDTPSIKTVSEVIGDWFLVSAGSVYERQRTLVRYGYLRCRPGRGPGSGVPATIENVALIVLSILVTDKPSESAIEVERALDRYPSIKRKIEDMLCGHAEGEVACWRSNSTHSLRIRARMSSGALRRLAERCGL